ncbi:hypothetical protein H1Q59_08010 [Holosporaceae bacterium 'Namur']|nr:hypothetical protein [Holosporaceae bacterium 'Namur']
MFIEDTKVFIPANDNNNTKLIDNSSVKLNSHDDFIESLFNYIINSNSDSSLKHDS